MEDLEKLPTNNNVNKPESGTYGEKADLNRLQQSLPEMPTGGPAGAPAPQLPRSGQNLRPAPSDPITGSAPLPRTPGSVPPLLARPTDYPNRPVSTPLGGNPQAPTTMTAQQRRLQILDALSRSPDVSEETKEWASIVRKSILGG